jgi:flagellar biosynthesis protein FlhA
MGFVMPSVRIQDNMQPGMLLVMDPRGDAISIPGETTKEPTFGLPAMWVDPASREEALFRGYTVVDPATVITTHVTEVVKDHMAELLSFAETQKLLDEMDKEHQKLVADLIPTRISLGGVQRVLQNLLSERVSIRDLPSILEGVSEACGHTRSVAAITEHARARLARQISGMTTNREGFIPLLVLGPEWEQAFAEALVGSGDDRQLAMPPSKIQGFVAAVRTAFDKQAMMGETPVLLTSPTIRPYVRSIIERFRPSTMVMSQNEISPKARIKTVGQV